MNSNSIKSFINFDKMNPAIACLIGKIVFTISINAFVNMTNYELEHYYIPHLKECLRENGVDIK